MDNKNEPILFSGEKLTALTRQSKMQKLKSKSKVNRQSSVDPNADTYFPVTYCGSIPVSYNKVTASIVDTFVGCLSIKSRPTSAVKYKKWRKKRRSVPLTSPQSNTMFQLLSSGSDDIDLPGNLEEEEDEENANDGSPTTQSLSDLDLNSQSIDSFLILENPDTRPRSQTISGSTYHPTSSLNSLAKSVDDHCLPDIHITHESTHRKHTYSEPGLKKRKWRFGILRRDRSSSSAEKIDSDSSLKGGESPSSLMNTDSLSSLQRRDSEGSLRENDSEGESPRTVPSRASTAPTPAIRVTESLESSGNDENDGDGQNDSKGLSSYLFICTVFINLSTLYLSVSLTIYLSIYLISTLLFTVCIYLMINTYTCIRIYTYMYIYIYTLTHTYTHSYTLIDIQFRPKKCHHTATVTTLVL